MPRTITAAYLNGLLSRGNIQGLAATLQNPEAPAVKQAALVLVNKVQEFLSHPGTGRLYKSRGVKSRLGRKGTKKRAKQLHQASAPGEPPAPDIGELRRSVGTHVEGGVRRVGSPLPQAPALEFGTQRIAARPAWRPALQAAKAEMTGVVVDELRASGLVVNLRGD